MDINAIVPDSWASRGIDAVGAVMLFLLKGTHNRFEKKLDDIDDMQTDHKLLRATVAGMEKTLDEIKEDGRDTRQDIKALLARHP